MDYFDSCAPVFTTFIHPEPLYQQANLLWGYALGLGSTIFALVIGALARR